MAGVLRIQSTTSRNLYVVDDSHTCEAKANGHKFCKHTVARRLLRRYVERLGAEQVTCETRTVRNWSARDGHQVVEGKRLTTKSAKSSMLAESERERHALKPAVAEKPRAVWRGGVVVNKASEIGN